MPAKAVRSLRQGLDSDVYQVVVRLLEDPQNRPDVRSLYQAIQRSNSSLKRKPKRHLEESLDRVLDVLGDDDDEEAVVEQEQKREAATEDSNIMNRSITGSWKVASLPSTAPGTPAPSHSLPSTVNGVSVSDTTAKREANGEPAKKRRKAPPVTEVDRSPPSDVRLEDLGGVDNVIDQMKDLLTLPLRMPEKYAALHLPLPRGILLHGPPGCGKSMLARGCAARLQVPFIEILGPSIVSGMSGESEKQVRELFEEARRLAPSLIFIDEIDVVAPKRENSQSQMEKRIVAQFLISMDTLAVENSDGQNKPVIVLAATNRPDSLDPALRRGGRFDTEISMGVPNEKMREFILRAQTRNTPMAADVDFQTLAKMTPGFVGADLRDLVGKAGAWTMKKYSQALENQVELPEGQMDIDQANTASTSLVRWDRLLQRTNTSMEEPAGFEDTVVPMTAFTSVLPDIVPSSKREGFATIPDTTWENIGALKAVREELQMTIVEPIKNPDRYAHVGITAPTGVLLWGPPGCGKTLLAKAAAAESRANFISVKGPELLNKYVGESERAVRTLFTRARASAPCVIFFDELDALVPRRDDSLNEASSRVVNTLLTELDGLNDRAGIYVISATNRPDRIDEAMLRPGRLETLLFVDLPGADERVEILRALIRGPGAAHKGTWPEAVEEIARSAACDGYSGADLEAMLRKAGQNAIRRDSRVVEMVDFEHAVSVVKGSVGSMDKYYAMKKKFASGF